MVQELNADSVGIQSNPFDILIYKDSIKQITKAIEALSLINREVLLLKKPINAGRKNLKYIEIPTETVNKSCICFQKLKNDS